MTSSLNTNDSRPAPHGRGSAIEPPNRFLKAHAVPDYADFENDPEFLAELWRVPTELASPKGVPPNIPVTLMRQP